MMEHIALIADVHGNLPALEAVLADIEARGIRRIFSLGDMIGKGPQPREVLDVVRNKCEKCVRGNWEDNLLFSDTISGDYVRKEIGHERLEWIRELPYGLFFRLSGCSIKLLHGRNTVPDVLRPESPREKLLELMDSLDDSADVVGFADIHRPFYRTLDGRTVFNIGSVGNPCDRLPQASYAVLHGMEGNTQGPFSIEIIRVPYDTELSVRAAMARPDMPFREEYCEEIRGAVYQQRRYNKK